ncbi:SRPBCC family protein [Devosia sp. ZW T5_3]|uniref:SRPBCC family protein n=1 Tax=Devosia sp. ZW T5_3 TaxID=3378085 RepID=UPI00385298FE
MTERSIAHGTFVIERKYPADPARVFRAWADPEIKKRWFAAGNDTKVFEFREGGREFAEGDGPNGGSYSYDVTYQDIVENNRIVYTYQMSLGGQRISVSVAAVELFADGTGTRLTVTEHGCFFDGLDTVDQRKRGTEWLMGELGTELARQLAN